MHLRNWQYWEYREYPFEIVNQMTEIISDDRRLFSDKENDDRIRRKADVIRKDGHIRSNR